MRNPRSFWPSPHGLPASRMPRGNEARQPRRASVTRGTFAGHRYGRRQCRPRAPIHEALKYQQLENKADFHASSSTRPTLLGLCLSEARRGGRTHQEPRQPTGLGRKRKPASGGDRVAHATAQHGSSAPQPAAKPPSHEGGPSHRPRPSHRYKPVSARATPSLEQNTTPPRTRAPSRLETRKTTGGGNMLNARHREICE